MIRKFPSNLFNLLLHPLNQYKHLHLLLLLRPLLLAGRNPTMNLYTHCADTKGQYPL